MRTHREFLKDPVLVRMARDGDAPALDRLAELDSARALTGPVLIAELGDQPVAALALDDARAVANPFLPTAEVVALLRLRALQMDPATAAGLPGRLAGWAAPAGQSVRDAGDRLHRRLERINAAIHRREHAIEGTGARNAGGR